MDKICIEGKVAVAVSKGGVGWSTAGDVSPFDVEFNELFITKQYEKAYDLAMERGIYPAGVYDVVIMWIDEGTKFTIIEFEGAEAIHIYDDNVWLEA